MLLTGNFCHYSGRGITTIAFLLIMGYSITFMIPIGINVFFWSLVGLVRYLFSQDKAVIAGRRYSYELSQKQLTKAQKSVAFCVPAHNEEIVIESTIKSLLRLAPATQIFVVSDGSSDKTAAIAESMGCNVLEFEVGNGKARALELLLSHFNLLDRFDYIVMADADTVFNEDYLKNALRLFAANPDMAAIAGHCRTAWPAGWKPTLARYFLSYRSRQYAGIQWLLTYAQTWKHTNVNPVVPGFASIYRSAALRQLKIHVPGICIEDFNLAFQIHRKRIGRIGHDISIGAATQDPNNFSDYVGQVTRWNTGFWQTVKHWKVWPSLFWASLLAFFVELVVYSVFLAMFPIILGSITLAYTGYITIPISSIQESAAGNFLMYIGGIYLGLFLTDYLVTLLVAFKSKQYFLIFYGLGFIFLRVVDAVIYLTTTPKALLKASPGYWVSPARRAQAGA